MFGLRTGPPNFAPRGRSHFWGTQVPTVHNFTLWDLFAGQRIMLAYKCTPERIAELGGEVVPYTAEEVDESDLNDDGVYLPPASDNGQDDIAPSA